VQAKAYVHVNVCVLVKGHVYTYEYSDAYASYTHALSQAHTHSSWR